MITLAMMSNGASLNLISGMGDIAPIFAATVSSAAAAGTDPWRSYSSITNYLHSGADALKLQLQDDLRGKTVHMVVDGSSTDFNLGEYFFEPPIMKFRLTRLFLCTDQVKKWQPSCSSIPQILTAPFSLKLFLRTLWAP
jgi:hypothetical protein